jgi:flavin reductase (DIM6/NTAB) family NADH-FMN oxidoreductase RutF
VTIKQGLEPLALRAVFGAFPTGVVAIAALIDDVPVGLAASSFASVSLDPPIVSVCVAHSSTTWPVLRNAPRLGISVLGEHQERAGRQLSSRGVDRFDALDWRATADGAVTLHGVSAWFDCSIYAHIAAGDHDIVLLEIHDLHADTGVQPLVFHGSKFRRLHH